MKALIFDPNVRRGLRFGDVAEPKPTAAQALVEVHAISLNFGTIDFEQERSRRGDRRIALFTVGGAGYGPDLSYLVELVSLGELDPQIGWRGNWQEVEDAADALLDRHVRGKVVLDLRQDE